jgi:anti-sigma regulatory factor (Ser/Thr protein kinase)
VTPDPATAVLPARPQPTPGVVTLKFRPYPSSIHSARRSIRAMLAGLVPDDHLETLALCVSELTTNALAAAIRRADALQFGWCHYDTPIHLGVLARHHWTRLDVRDPEPSMHPPGEPAGPLDEHGRGLGIVAEYGRLAYTLAPDHKTIHAVIPYGGKLTAADATAALPAGAVPYER